MVGKNIINTFDFKDEQLRKWSNKSMLKCPVCNERMIYCHGEYKIPYFRHEKNCECLDTYSEGITEEHLKGVQTLYNWLKFQNDILNLELERWIPETRQRPDIYFEKEENGEIKKYVIELQCSPISSQWLERHDLYRLNNISDIWIFGTEKYDIINHIKNIENKTTIHNYSTKAIEREIINSSNQQYIYLNGNGLIFVSKNSIYQITDVVKYMFDCRYIKTQDISIFDVISNRDVCSELIKNEELEKIRLKELHIDTTKQYIVNKILNDCKIDNADYVEKDVVQFYKDNNKYVLEFISNGNEINDISKSYKQNYFYIPFLFVEKDNPIKKLKTKSTTICEFKRCNYIYEDEIISIKDFETDSFKGSSTGTNRRGKPCIRYHTVFYYKYDYLIKPLSEFDFKELTFIKNINHTNKLVIVDDFYKKPKNIKKIHIEKDIFSENYLKEELYSNVINFNCDCLYLIIPKSYGKDGKPIRKSEHQLLEIKNVLNKNGYSNVDIYWG